LNTYTAADGVLAVSEKEARLIDDLAGGPRLAHVVADTEDLEPSAVPLEERKGILFVGNFNHPPNVEAAEHLVRDVLPRVDPGVLAAHPVLIVGNGLEKHAKQLRPLTSSVRMVGWVPSVLPYLQQARLSVVPVLHGAGTKRKVIQSLLVGTPTVASTIGAEGLDLSSGEHVLIADDPAGFAACINRLAVDDDLWQHLALTGRSHVLASHGPEIVRSQLEHAISTVMSRPPKTLSLLAATSSSVEESTDEAYRKLVASVRQVLRDKLPTNAHLAVVSKGDDAFLELPGMKAWHFPRASTGQYAGYHPADSAAAIAHLDAQRAAGVEFLVVPRTSFWWFEHYTAFRDHLERDHRVMVADPDTCLIFHLRAEVRHEE
jgi:hypothetical protein